VAESGHRFTRESVTGLVLAGGLSTRMGGADKGLQPYRGLPLVQHTLQRLAPQVGPLLISANRELARYAAFGIPLCQDSMGGFPGPLAGLLAGLRSCRTPWLASVPCDAPHLPDQLVARLGAAVTRSGASAAYAATLDAEGRQRPQPVFCLLQASLADDLQHHLQAGERRVRGWLERHQAVAVPFDDAEAFGNFNTPQDLQR
jgi:molybdopterin-guanine dinucleotide biosynthesis protein A